VEEGILIVVSPLAGREVEVQAVSDRPSKRLDWSSSEYRLRGPIPTQGLGAGNGPKGNIDGRRGSRANRKRLRGTKSLKKVL